MNEYEIKFERSVSDNLSRDTAMSPYSDTHMSPELYKQEPIKRRRLKSAIGRRLKADESLCPIDGSRSCRHTGRDTLWDEQNGNVAAYHSPSAFYKRWCRQEKPPRATSVAMPAHKADKHENQAAYMLKPGKDGVRPFDKMTPTLQADMRNHNPVLDRMLRHVN